MDPVSCRRSDLRFSRLRSTSFDEQSGLAEERVSVVICGAYDYTGWDIAERAVERGLRPILAGRSSEKLSASASRLRLPARTFALDDPAAFDSGLQGIRVVIHAAGPF